MPSPLLDDRGKDRIGFVGSGAVGGALARSLTRAEYRVTAVSSRHLARAERLAADLPGCLAVDDPQAVVDRADLVFLSVPDDVIEAVCDALHWRAGMAVVHCSGARSVDLLTHAAACGAEVGTFHPLQTFTGRPEDAARLTGTVFGIEAQEPLRSRLSGMARSLAGQPVVLTAESKPLYHASAVLISNYVVTLAALAADLWSAFGIERDDALPALLPLLQGTVANLESVGLPTALTGPVARGDAATIEHHLQSLVQDRPALLSLYRALGCETLPLARERGLDDASIDAVSRLFECASSDRPVPEPRS